MHPWNARTATSARTIPLLHARNGVTGCETGRKTCTTDEDALAAAVATYGPLSIGINSGDKQACDWAQYKSWVLSKSCPAKPNLIDHSVQLVGYDKSGTTPLLDRSEQLERGLGHQWLHASRDG